MTREKNANGTLYPSLILPDEIRDGDRYGYKIIAVINDDGSWCAYWGSTSLEDDTVSTAGGIVPYELARELFPVIDRAVSRYIW
jgi:hypothetical protein